MLRLRTTLPQIATSIHQSISSAQSSIPKRKTIRFVGIDSEDGMHNKIAPTVAKARPARYRKRSANKQRKVEAKDSGVNQSRETMSSEQDGSGHLFADASQNRPGSLGPSPPVQIQPVSKENASTPRIERQFTTDNKHHRALVHNFHRSIRWSRSRAQIHSDSCRTKVFHYYNAIKQKVPSALQYIPGSAWRRLWKLQSSFRPLDIQRIENLKMLADDIAGQGLDISHQQKILDLEKKSEQGQSLEAIEEWEGIYRHYSKDRKWESDWLELGARLYASAGNLDQACSLIDLLMQRFDNIDPRLMTFLIWRHIETRDTERVRKAWGLYKNLRDHIWFRLNTDDYSSIFSCFLRNEHRNAALQVLMDLAQTTHLPDPELRNGIILSLAEKLLKSHNKIQRLHKASLSLLAVMPKDIDLGAFFGYWLERASRFNKTSSAHNCAQIIELMFEHGQALDPEHMNKLIGAWFLSDKESAGKAESAAWNMISKRMDIVEKKDSEGDQASREERLSDGEQAQFLRRDIPAAAARTFAELAKYYAKMGQRDYAHYVVRLLRSSDLHLNSRSIRAVLMMHLTLNEPLHAWHFFEHVRESDPDAINLFVFGDLWRGLNLHLRNIRRTYEKMKNPPFRGNTNRSEWHRLVRKHTSVEEEMERLHESIFPDGRTLFAETYRYITRKHLKPLPDKREPIPHSLYDRVVGALMLKGDSLGAIVAMEALHDTLGLTPTLNTFDIIVHYTAREARNVERKQGSAEPIRYYADMARGVLEYLFVNMDIHTSSKQKPRVSDLYRPGFMQERGDVLLVILSKYLRTLAEKHWGSPEIVDLYKLRCKAEFGIPTESEWPT